MLHDEMSLVMLINKIQSAEDLAEFRKISEEIVDNIYGNAPEEIKERDALRKEYLANFRKSFRARLENIEVVSPEEYERRMKGKKDN